MTYIMLKAPLNSNQPTNRNRPRLRPNIDWPNVHVTFRCEILISLTTFGFLAFAVLIIAKVYSVYKSCRNSLFLCIQHCEKWTLFVLQTVQQRGAAVIQARKLSSAMSAAKATGDHLRDWWNGTKQVGTFWLLLDFIHFGIFFSAASGWISGNETFGTCGECVLLFLLVMLSCDKGSSVLR